MGVIYFWYVLGRMHESNLPSNICTTAGKKTQFIWYVEKWDLLSETIFEFLPKLFYDSMDLSFCIWCLLGSTFLLSIPFAKRSAGPSNWILWLVCHAKPQPYWKNCWGEKGWEANKFNILQHIEHNMHTYIQSLQCKIPHFAYSIVT